MDSAVSAMLDDKPMTNLHRENILARRQIGSSILRNDVRSTNLTSFFCLLVSVEEKVKAPRRQRQRWFLWLYRASRTSCRLPHDLKCPARRLLVYSLSSDTVSSCHLVNIYVIRTRRACGLHFGSPLILFFSIRVISLLCL